MGMLVCGASLLAGPLRRVVYAGGHRLGLLPGSPGALALQAGPAHTLGVAPGHGANRPCPPRAVELPAVTAAGQAAIVLGVTVRHAATIHDMSLRTNYTWGSHSEMMRKLLNAPSHTGAGARQIEGTPCGQAHSTPRRYRPPSGNAPRPARRSAPATWAPCSGCWASTPDSARCASPPRSAWARAGSAKSSTAPGPSATPASSSASPT